jgi:hypothetical protein
VDDSDCAGICKDADREGVCHGGGIDKLGLCHRNGRELEERCQKGVIRGVPPIRSNRQPLAATRRQYNIRWTIQVKEFAGFLPGCVQNETCRRHYTSLCLRSGLRPGLQSSMLSHFHQTFLGSPKRSCHEEIGNLRAPFIDWPLIHLCS